jgi:hypothetical protein
MVVLLVGDQEGVLEAGKKIKRIDGLEVKEIVWSESFFISGNADDMTCAELFIVAFKYRKELRDPVIEFLAGLNGITSARVLNYYLVRDNQGNVLLADRFMGKGLDFDGMILGISHAEVGIIPERLAVGKFINLSISSQDLYSDYRIFKYCCERYSDDMKRLKTVIIDMYDYSYFNYDVSMASIYPTYIYQGGYREEKHNWDNNKLRGDMDFDGLLAYLNARRKSRITEEQLNVWSLIADKDESFHPDTFMYSTRDQEYRGKVVNDEDVNSFVLGKYVQKEYEETIRENKKIFAEFLELIYSLNPDMRVYLVLIPRYEGVKVAETILREKWKTIFYDIVEEQKSKYPFELLDFVGSEIAGNKKWYYDAAHFNCYGAMCFTDLLNDCLGDETSRGAR